MSIPQSGNKFNAIQFHVHTFSEHQIQGQGSGGIFPAELHVVHQEETEESFAVFGTVISVGSHEHPQFEGFLRGWEAAAQLVEDSCGAVDERRRDLANDGELHQSRVTKFECPAVGSATFGFLGSHAVFPSAQPNIYDLPTDKDFGVYTYKGGLTTPPCTEIVNWNLLDAPMEISAGQLLRLKKLIICYVATEFGEDGSTVEKCSRGTIADENGSTSRPTQPLNGREVVHRCRDGPAVEIQDVGTVGDGTLPPDATTTGATSGATGAEATTTTTTGSGGLEVGMTACVEGFVMDFFCIDRGTLFDNPSVVTLEGPDVHSVHCLIDVNSCISSHYEVLLDPATPGALHSRGFTLSDNAKDQVVALAREIGVCDTCNGGGTLEMGMRAAFEATVLDLGVDGLPPTIDATNVILSSFDAPTCDQIGLPNIIDLVDPASFKLGDDSASLRRRHLAHGSLMLIGWGFLLPSGVLIAKFLKHRPDGLWFRIHKPLQIFGLVCTLTGWIIALLNFNVFGDVGNTNYQHGILGCTVMTLGLLQPINAFLRPHAPEAGEEKPLLRLLWEILHKSFGWIAILLAIVTISLGTTILPNLQDQRTFQLAYAVGCGGGLTLLIVLICVDKAKFRREEARNHSNMEGRKYHS